MYDSIANQNSQLDKTKDHNELVISYLVDNIEKIVVQEMAARNNKLFLWCCTMGITTYLISLLE